LLLEDHELVDLEELGDIVFEVLDVVGWWDEAGGDVVGLSIVFSMEAEADDDGGRHFAEGLVNVVGVR